MSCWGSALFQSAKVFNSKNNLLVHIRSMHLLHDSQCQHCGKGFKNRKALDNHINAAHRTGKCDYCNEHFKLGSLRKHKLFVTECRKQSQ